MGPLLYLDACAIQRGMDALTTPRLRLRLTPLDAFHVALACSVSAAFVTTDKRLLRRLRRVEPPPLRGLDPLEAVVELFGE